MTPHFGNIPFDKDDYGFKHDPDNYCSPYEVLNVSEWNPEVDSQIEELTSLIEEQLAAGGLADEDTEGVTIGAPGEGMLKGRLDDEGEPNYSGEGEEEEGKAQGGFDSTDEDGWSWQ